MSGKATGWARDQRSSGKLPDGGSIQPGIAHAILMLMADYADAKAELYPSVPTMAAESQWSVRSVQNALASLELDGLIERETRTTATGKATSNRYRLNLEGCTPCTPTGAWHAPSGVQDVHRDGACGAPSIVNQELDPSSKAEALEHARAAFDRAGEAWKTDDPDRFSRPRALTAWNVAVGGGVDADALADAAVAFVAEGKARRGRLPMLHFWLKDGLFEGRLAARVAVAEAMRTRFADETIRAAVVGAKGEDWTVSWLDRAVWDAGARRINAATKTAALELNRSLGWLWRKLGVNVADPERV